MVMSDSSTSLPVRIFQMDDCIEWWIGAATPEQMRDAYRDAYGDESLDDGDDLPRPLSDNELDVLRFYYGPEDAAPDIVQTRTFREQLAIELAAGVPEPRMFACEES